MKDKYYPCVSSVVFAGFAYNFSEFLLSKKLFTEQIFFPLGIWVLLEIVLDQLLVSEKVPIMASVITAVIGFGIVILALTLFSKYIITSGSDKFTGMLILLGVITFFRSVVCAGAATWKIVSKGKLD